MKNDTLSSEKPKVNRNAKHDYAEKAKKGMLCFYVIHNSGWKIEVIFLQPIESL
jgi:hypothetical protein